MEINESTPVKKIARLTARQHYQLAEAVKREQERFRKERPTVAETAEELTRTLGFPVGPSSVRTAMETTGVTWDTSGRAKRREPNRLDLDVYRPDQDEGGQVRLWVVPECRPDDRRLCGVTVPRHVPPAESAVWLRRLADLLDSHGAELRAVTKYEIDYQTEEANDEKVRAGWEAILAEAAI